jgi:hypothetical protein
MSHIIKHCPHLALDKIEEVSYLYKNHGKNLDIDDFLKTKISKVYS